MSATLIDVRPILEDLNGIGQPHGLHDLYLEVYRFPVSTVPRNLTKEYRAKLRHCVDLWLEHRGVLERRQAGRHSVVHDEFEYSASVVAGAVGPSSTRITHAEAQRAIQVNQIVGRLAGGYKVLPAIRDDSYALSIAPIRKTVNNRDMPKLAAEKMFMEMLGSDWRLRIAKCADSHCNAPYFRLGKVKTSKKAVLCHACRKAVKATHNQERVENNRKKAKRKLCKFVAEQFGIEILQDPAWKKDEQRKSQMVKGVNAYIQKARGPLNSLYPRGITAKWFMSGQRRKNWQLIEARVKKKGLA